MVVDVGKEAFAIAVNKILAIANEFHIIIV